jgi:hypothetical protein
MGKAYVHRQGNSSKGDHYPTPKSLVYVAESHIYDIVSPGTEEVLEPCCGNGELADALEEIGVRVHRNDLYWMDGGKDYLTTSYPHRVVITNPPFSKWDQFVAKAKSEAEIVMMIGRLNYFGTEGRSRSGIWQNLKHVDIFNRYVDYRSYPRTDGKFQVGAMATGWFIWDHNYIGHPMIRILNVQDYVLTKGDKDDT